MCSAESRAFSIALLVLLFVPPAFANSTSYTLSGTLTNLAGTSQQLVSGSVTWNNLLGVTSYSLGLSNATGAASCSSSCTLLLASFAGTGKWAGDTEYLSGLLTPSTPKLALVIYSNRGKLLAKYSGNVTWTVPEPSSPMELILVVAVLVIAFFKTRISSPGRNDT